MGRLIDADRLLKGKKDHELISTHLIWNAPTVDAVEVVRCKDCWVFHQDETWNHKKGLCGWFDMPVGVNDFCSIGDRKEDER